MEDKPVIPFGTFPAVVRTLLEPFRAVMNPSPPPMSDGIEPTFIADHSRLTDEQTLAIGRVATSWAVLEHIIDMVLARLALAPAYPALALSVDLSIDNQLKAMKTLVGLHRERYRLEINSEKLLDAIAAMPTRIAKLKDERNLTIHTVWTRTGKSEFNKIGARPMTLSTASKNVGHKVLTLDHVNDLARKIQETADELFVLAQHLVAVDEPLHAKSLAQEADRRRAEIESKPQDPPQT
jgi:hypothetical protein